MSSPTRPEIQPATLISRTPHQVPGKLLVTELFFSVPLIHSSPLHNQKRLRIFCRAAERYEDPIAPAPSDKKDEAATKPWLVWVTGGPGFGSAAPQDMAGFTEEVLGRGYKFLCFDHRGMGLSSPCTAATITAQGTPAEQAEYLSHFRADSAVQDLEAIRLCLTADYADDRKKWTIMGGSYGGFVCLTYLSHYPQGLRAAFPVAGMAPVTQKSPDVVFGRLLKKTQERNKTYFTKFPEDLERVKKIVKLLKEKDVVLPSGGQLSAGRFLEMGIQFGFHGGLDKVHDAVLRATNDLEWVGYLTRPTLSCIAEMGAFDDAVLYAVLHGPCYAQGTAPNWGFDRVFKAFLEDQSALDPDVFFTGEMVFRRAFDDYIELRELKDAAEILESKSDWPDLYDIDQLQKNEVPVYAATFVDDMYVGFEFAQETAALVKRSKVFITNSLFHDAIRGKNEEVMKALWALKDDTLD